MITHRHLIDVHRGKTVIVLGCGPSLNDYDLTDPFFRGNITIGSNGIVGTFKPTYYFIGDGVAYSRWGRFMWSGKTVPLIGSSLLRRVPSLQMVPRGVVVDYALKDYVGRPDKNGTIFNGRTSGVIMAYLAYYMGAKNIFMLGIDGYSGFESAKTAHFDGRSKAVPVISPDVVVAKNLLAIFKACARTGRCFFDLSVRDGFPQVPKLQVFRQFAEK